MCIIEHVIVGSVFVLYGISESSNWAIPFLHICWIHLQSGIFIVRPKQESNFQPYALTLWANGSFKNLVIRRKSDGEFALGSEKVRTAINCLYTLAICVTCDQTQNKRLSLLNWWRRWLLILLYTGFKSRVTILPHHTNTLTMISITSLSGSETTEIVRRGRTRLWKPS